MRNTNEQILEAGIDVGSTTTKIVIRNPETGEVLYSDYRRHYADQIRSIIHILEPCLDLFGDRKLRFAMTGSGAKPIAEQLHIPFVQEVAANASALKNLYPSIGSAIELGGQDAKMIFFVRDPKTGKTQASDMRMNGSCAGGTGAFIDEIASVLKTPVEKFNALAEKGTCVYDISGRCGVYAKTDIQPLLNQGAAKADLALSTFHAIAKQTIGGLAQGLKIEKPVAFEGGPLTFNPALIRVFAERLNLSHEDILIPDHPELMVAYGAALSLDHMMEEGEKPFTVQELSHRLEQIDPNEGKRKQTKPFFASEQERKAFEKRHKKKNTRWNPPKEGSKIRAYLGIDSGSTTTKFVLLNEEEEIIDYFYAPNEGEPLEVAKKALQELKKRYDKAKTELEILSAGTTGYGEMLFAEAFQAECHTVETVAHARAAEKYVKDATFILDIGGQDMKAMWLENGVITNILVNEACSSGCGSFLENFASTLHIPAKEIAQAAFSSREPAALGSRCTVFMNSSIITEQRNGRKPEDIMAGLCRSIIENVFTKVVRLSNVDMLGDRIIVQGGTFENDAVLRAMEEYIGKEVIRAPYPGLMGAIGAALLAAEHHRENPEHRTFIGLEALDSFSYKQQANAVCPFCTNHCKRTIITFSNGHSWVTNNRCEKGSILGEPEDQEVSRKLKEQIQKEKAVPNLFKTREKLLFSTYPCTPLREVTEDSTVIGLPRVLSYWEYMPFWSTFFTSLGFRIKLSDKSTRKIYEQGLSAVTSDTVCFPAKLVHGHIRNLEQKGVDRIFMPAVTAVPSENTEKTSESMCAIVKGYPLVIKNSDNPEEERKTAFDAPLFHWHTKADRDRQLTKYMEETFRISPGETRAAMEAGDRAQASFKSQLEKEGEAVLKQAEETGKFAVVLASRPYQNDALVNHDLPEMFTGMGIPVLTADSLPGVNQEDLSRSRLDIVNNFHARMLSSAVLAASSEALEYVQIVSFGCGHDAYLSDEIIRLMKEISGKTPLVLKLDESDIQGPLRIRVRSFLETVAMRRAKAGKLQTEPLKEPYPVKYTKRGKNEKTVLVPNTSHAFSQILSAAFCTQGVRAVPLEMGGEEAIRLGKKYVHNDICFPAQMVIGEALAALKSGRYDSKNTAIGMGKYIGDCRLTHYSALLRKALDDAGFPEVPILTNDDKDYHDLHPGFKMNMLTAAEIAFGLSVIDALEELLRKIRPYEVVKGSANRAFARAMDEVVQGLEQRGIPGMEKGFKKAIRLMKEVPYDRSCLKPKVLIVGEYLLNFHPGANHHIEDYLEKNGFEIIEARMTDVIRKTYFYQEAQIKEYHVKKGVGDKVWYYTANQIFGLAHSVTDSIAKEHPLYEPACRMEDLVKASDPIIHHTFDTGEGVLIPAEILHHAAKGCRAFVILQPFGCLPNHVVGRGITKKLKEMYPDAQILPLDYDPDVSFANIENRLQMLVMNIKTEKKQKKFP